MKLNQNTNARCPAMIEAGIEDPNSREGILFCAGSLDGKIKSRCPYDCCILFEGEQNTSKRHFAKDRADYIKGLRDKGLSPDDIAILLDVKLKVVQRYLRK